MPETVLEDRPAVTEAADTAAPKKSEPTIVTAVRPIPYLHAGLGDSGRKDAVSMKKATGRSWSQMTLAANTPMLLKAGLVDGDTHAGMLAAGQVVGMIDDLPSCEELVDRVMRDAVLHLRAAASCLID